jgi:hypothetical protein
MSKAEILQELPKLTKDERFEIRVKLAEMDSDGWLDAGRSAHRPGEGPDRSAPGRTWRSIPRTPFRGGRRRRASKPASVSERATRHPRGRPWPTSKRLPAGTRSSNGVWVRTLRAPFVRPSIPCLRIPWATVCATGGAGSAGFCRTGFRIGFVTVSRANESPYSPSFTRPGTTGTGNGAYEEPPAATVGPDLRRSTGLPTCRVADW